MKYIIFFLLIFLSGQSFGQLPEINPDSLEKWSIKGLTSAIRFNTDFHGETTYSYFHEYSIDYKDPSGLSKTSESAHFMQRLRGETVEENVKYVPGQFLWYKYSRSGMGREKVRVVDHSAKDEKVRIFPVLMIGSDIHYLCVTLDGEYFYLNEKDLEDDLSKSKN